MSTHTTRSAARPVLTATLLTALIGPAARAAVPTYAFRTLYSFTGAVGNNPGPLTIDAAGNLYGTTATGGGGGDGAVFKYQPSVNRISTLATFAGAAQTGASSPLILDPAGDLYGTTGGSPSARGTVFQVTPGGQFNTLAQFTGTNGSGPTGPLARDAAGNLYGVTNTGGSDFGANYTGGGTLFKVAAGTNALTTLRSFGPQGPGIYPTGGLTADAGGNLYGVTTGGGTRNYGTVFAYAPATGTIASTSFAFTDGSTPTGPLLLAGGTVYGATAGGGASNGGTLFAVHPGDAAVRSLTSFYNGIGSDPAGGLYADAAGDLFGATQVNGGTGAYGTLFELPAGSSTPVTLVTFTNTGNGAQPTGGLVADAAGDLFGTTTAGIGTIFELVNTSPVPEPASAAVLAVAVAGLLGRRRRRPVVVVTG